MSASIMSASSGMSGGIGLVIGAVLGIASYRLLTAIAARPGNESSRALLNALAKAELVVFPILGVVIGAFLWPSR